MCGHVVRPFLDQKHIAWAMFTCKKIAEQSYNFIASLMIFQKKNAKDKIEKTVKDPCIQ